MLRGVKVLDMTRILAGPYCTMMMADEMADVVKVERPGIGDETRQWGPPFKKISDSSLSTYFMAFNRNKKSIAIDMKTQTGANLIRDLASKADVLVENFVTDQLKEFDLDFESIKKVNPDIIYCSLTGFGQSGPMKSEPLFDIAAAALGGLLSVTGEKDGPPCKAGVAVTDLLTGTLAFGAINMALYQKASKQSTFEACHIDCSLMNSQVAMMSHIATAYLNCGIVPERWGTAHANIVPYQAFKSKDQKYLIVGGSFQNICKAVDLPDLAEDPRFLTNKLRVQNRKVLIDILTQKFLQFDCGTLEARLKELDLPHGCVNNIEEVFNHPQVRHNQMQFVFDDEPSLKGVNSALAWSEGHPTEGQIPKLRPPHLGEHTASVLKSWLGLSLQQIETLSKNKVVF